jgi:hypothetical protein
VAFLDGERGHDGDRKHRRRATGLLARLHRALFPVHMKPRPPFGAPRIASSDLDDPELDGWPDAFNGRHPERQPLHGDFYSGDVLVRAGRIVGLVDWDEAFIGPPERELAWAAWE